MSTSANRPRPAVPPFIPALILRKILLTNDGRDKILKCTQYSLKLFLIFHLTYSKYFPASTSQKYLTTKSVISQLSLTRKIIRTGASLNSYSELLEALQERTTTKGGLTPTQQTRNSLAVLNALIGIVNALADDIICYGKLGILPPKIVKPATPLADQLWFLTIFLDVYELMQNIRDKQIALSSLTSAPIALNTNGVPVDAIDSALADHSPEDKLKKRKLQNDLFMANVSLTKLGADFVFCGVDVFGLRLAGWSEEVQTVAGLVSAVLGTYKLWLKNR
ncbi:hypothetical protein HDV00_003265 [Rhizophlyctis rosea]|nr:hypothetical protein HDV00_003265 [Rhizophlyctis rosea]